MLSPGTWNGKESCFKLIEKAISQVRFEIEQIDHLIEAYVGLLGRVQESPPDLVEITAVASVLHSFYNGIENIFLSIAKEIDRNVPATAQWHRDLLTQMTEARSTRGPVLSAEAAHQLVNYLGFRHFYRHSYSFFLEWDELERLVTPLAEVWEQTRRGLLLFLDNLNK